MNNLPHQPHERSSAMNQCSFSMSKVLLSLQEKVYPQCQNTFAILNDFLHLFLKVPPGRTDDYGTIPGALSPSLEFKTEPYPLILDTGPHYAFCPAGTRSGYRRDIQIESIGLWNVNCNSMLTFLFGVL